MDEKNISVTTEDWPPKECQIPETALGVDAGVPEPPKVNPYIKKFFKKKPALLSVDEYMAGIEAGNVTIVH